MPSDSRRSERASRDDQRRRSTPQERPGKRSAPDDRLVKFYFVWGCWAHFCVWKIFFVKILEWWVRGYFGHLDGR